METRYESTKLCRVYQLQIKQQENLKKRVSLIMKKSYNFHYMDDAISIHFWILCATAESNTKLNKYVGKKT
jgi:L-2-hydroxyglutarate oxidase LhgO